MYSFVRLFILFLSCAILQFCHSLLNHVSRFLSSFAPLSFFCSSTFFLCFTTPFSQCLHTKPLIIPQCNCLTGQQNTGLLQLAAGSRVVCIGVSVRWNMCTDRVKSLCEWFCDCVCKVCVRLMWCRVESSKSPHIGPETAAPTHLNLFNLNVTLKFPFQS